VAGAGVAASDPLYRIEGEAGRLPDGMYDRMGSMARTKW